MFTNANKVTNYIVLAIDMKEPIFKMFITEEIPAIYAEVSIKFCLNKCTSKKFNFLFNSLHLNCCLLRLP